MRYDTQLRLTLEEGLRNELTLVAALCGESRNEFLRKAAKERIERIKKEAPKSLRVKVA